MIVSGADRLRIGVGVYYGLCEKNHLRRQGIAPACFFKLPVVILMY